MKKLVNISVNVRDLFYLPAKQVLVSVCVPKMTGSIDVSGSQNKVTSKRTDLSSACSLNQLKAASVHLDPRSSPNQSNCFLPAHLLVLVVF